MYELASNILEQPLIRTSLDGTRIFCIKGSTRLFDSARIFCIRGSFRTKILYSMDKLRVGFFKSNAKRLGSFFIRLYRSDSLSEVAQKYAQFRQE